MEIRCGSNGGEIYELKGMSSVDKLQAILRHANIQGQFAKYKKHEKMVNFLEALEWPPKNFFSSSNRCNYL